MSYRRTADNPQIADFKTALRKLYANGYHPIPIVPHDQTYETATGPKQGGKTPGRLVGTAWQPFAGWQRFEHEAPSKGMLQRWSDWADRGFGIPNIGNPGGGAHNLFLLDFDTTHPDLAFEAQRIAAAKLPTAPKRTGAYPKTGILLRCTEPLRKIRSAVYELDGYFSSVEVLPSGTQSVFYGIHPDTQEPYTWEHGSPFDTPITDIPLVTPQTLHELIHDWETVANVLYDANQKSRSSETKERENKPEELLTADQDRVYKALDYIPNEDLHYDEWVRIGHALKSALRHDEAEALEAWHTFSAKSDKYDPDVTNDKWQSIKTEKVSGIGAGTLLWIAGQNGFNAKPDPKEEFSAVELPADAKEHPRESAKKRLYFKTPTDCETVNLTANYLIKGVLDRQSMAIVYGDSNTGKTFLAMDMAYHIAAGTPWDGKRTHQTGVLYVATEAGRSAEKRLKALGDKLGRDVPFALVPCPVNLLDPDADTKPLIELAREAEKQLGCPIGLTVVDTLSRAMAGGNENASEDMGAFVSNVDRLRGALSCAGLVVHHSGKDKAKGARGHSLLRAATDTELEVAVDSDTGARSVRATKQRDMEAEGAIGFMLSSVALGTDSDGDPVTTCVVVTEGSEDWEAVRGEFEVGLSDDETEALDALKKALDDPRARDIKGRDGCKSATTALWASYYFDPNPDTSGDKTPTSLRARGAKQRQEFYRLKKALVTKRFIEDCVENQGVALGGDRW